MADTNSESKNVEEETVTPVSYIKVATKPVGPYIRPTTAPAKRRFIINSVDAKSDVKESQTILARQHSAIQNPIDLEYASKTVLDLVNDSKKADSPGSNLNDFEVLEELGSGSFGSVYRAKSIIDGHIYVLKKIKVGHLSISQQRQAVSEVLILQRVENQNIIRYITSFIDGAFLCICMEYAPYGDLEAIVNALRINKRRLNEDVIWYFLKQLCDGLCYLHSQRIVHRDIKMLNIMLSHNNLLKIGDLGNSRLVTGGNIKSGRVGTPLYTAPEILLHHPYDYKVDTWSLGVTIYALAFRIPPFMGKDSSDLKDQVLNFQPRQLTSYSSALNSLLTSMLSKNPQNRPTISSVLEKAVQEVATRGVPRFIDCPHAPEALKQISVPLLKNDENFNLSSIISLNSMKQLKRLESISAGLIPTDKSDQSSKVSGQLSSRRSTMVDLSRKKESIVENVSYPKIGLEKSASTAVLEKDSRLNQVNFNSKELIVASNDFTALNAASNGVSALLSKISSGTTDTNSIASTVNAAPLTVESLLTSISVKDNRRFTFNSLTVSDKDAKHHDLASKSQGSKANVPQSKSAEIEVAKPALVSKPTLISKPSIKDLRLALSPKK